LHVLVSALAYAICFAMNLMHACMRVMRQYRRRARVVALLGGLSAYLSVCAYALLSFVQYSRFIGAQILETHEEGSEWRSD
jgi:hypothetical protein